jgi:PhnB protein
MPFTPYLNFAGNCREAFTRYQEIFGGELVLLDASSMPADEGAPPPPRPDAVLHAALMTGRGELLMASDVWDVDTFPGVHGTYVSFGTPDVDEAKRVFEALADGGEIEMGLEATFFSPAFGVLRDWFGTLWMVNADAEQPPGS